MAETIDARLSLPATALGVRTARCAVDEALRQLSGDDDLRRDVRLCVSEAVTNAVRHAYDGHGDESVEVTVLHERAVVTVIVRDTGRGLVERRSSEPGGYGLEIIDELTTSHVITTVPGDGTELAMSFDLRPAPAGRQRRSAARVSRAAARA